MIPSRVGLATFLLLSTGANHASADGAWGRLRDDTAVQGDAGIGSNSGSNSGGNSGSTALSASLALRYLQTAGVYSTWMIPIIGEEDHNFSVSIGTELRPLFLPRFFLGKQGSNPRISMAIDSIALRMGIVTANKGRFGRAPGFETGLGFGVPFLQNVSGPWLSTACAWRWSHNTMLTSHDSKFVWTIFFGWQTTFKSGLVDWKDKR